jgi:hypothetical protein
MRQERLTKESQDQQKSDGTLERTLAYSKFQNQGGFVMQPVDRKWADETREQRREVFEESWGNDGFPLCLGVIQSCYSIPDAMTRCGDSGLKSRVLGSRIRGRGQLSVRWNRSIRLEQRGCRLSRRILKFTHKTMSM